MGSTPDFLLLESALPQSMATPQMEVCDGYCCVAKRFDRPFRLPSNGGSNPQPRGQTSLVRSSSSSSSSLIRPESWVRLSDSSSSHLLEHQRSDSVEELTEDAPSASDIQAAPRRMSSREPDAERDDDEETEEEEAAARVRLNEILDAVVAEAEAAGGARSSTLGVGTGEGAAGGGGGGGGGAVASPGSSFVAKHLDTLAHLSHRRERHCRVILQHPAADTIVNYIADILAGGAYSSLVVSKSLSLPREQPTEAFFLTLYRHLCSPPGTPETNLDLNLHSPFVFVLPHIPQFPAPPPLFTRTRPFPPDTIHMHCTVTVLVSIQMTPRREN